MHGFVANSYFTQDALHVGGGGGMHCKNTNCKNAILKEQLVDALGHARFCGVAFVHGIKGQPERGNLDNGECKVLQQKKCSHYAPSACDKPSG